MLAIFGERPSLEMAVRGGVRLQKTPETPVACGSQVCLSTAIQPVYLSTCLSVSENWKPPVILSLEEARTRELLPPLEGGTIPGKCT